MQQRTKIYTSWDDLPIIMDLPLVAIITGLNNDYVRKLARDKKIPAWKASEREWRINKSDLQKWIEGRKQA